MGRGPNYQHSDEAAQEADDYVTENGTGRSFEKEPDIPTHVEIFAGTGCKYCEKAKALCEERNIPYTYKNMDDDEEAFFQLVGRIKKWETVPQIFYGSQHIGGHDELVKFLGA